MQHIYNVASLVIIIILALGVYFRNRKIRMLNASIGYFMDEVASTIVDSIKPTCEPLGLRITNSEITGITGERGKKIFVEGDQGILVTIQIWWNSPAYGSNRSIRWICHKVDNCPPITKTLGLAHLGIITSLTNDRLKSCVPT